MAEAPPTRPTLLLRLRNAKDGDAWAQFVNIYTPLVFGFLRKKGLQEADAADVTQDVLQSVSQALPRLDYDPKVGSFRGWLFTVVRNKLHDFHRRQTKNPPADGDTETMRQLQQLPSSPDEDEEMLWQEEYRQQLFNWAAEQVRPNVEESSWQAFWQTAVEGKSGSQAAENLGMKVAAEYMAKSRVLARIKESIREVQGNDEHD